MPRQARRRKCELERRTADTRVIVEGARHRQLGAVPNFVAHESSSDPTATKFSRAASRGAQIAPDIERFGKTSNAGRSRGWQQTEGSVGYVLPDIGGHPPRPVPLCDARVTAVVNLPSVTPEPNRHARWDLDNRSVVAADNQPTNRQCPV